MAHSAPLKKQVALLLGALLLVMPIAGLQAKSVDELVGVAAITRTTLQRISVQQAALALAAESKDGDGDGYIESPSMLLGSGGPVGGGRIPSASAAPKDDSYGTKLGYCAFDNGTTGVLTGLIAGAPSNANAPVLTVITAGADNVFQTTCADVFAAVSAGTGTGVKGDDFAITYNSTQLKLGNSGSLYHGDPVADVAALNALAAQQASDPAKVVLRVGEVRLTKNDNSLHSWNGTAWTSVTATSSGPAIPWASGTGGAYYSSTPIVVGANVAAPNNLTVVDTGGGTPVGVQTSGQFNGTNYYAADGSLSGFSGVDNTNNALVLNAKTGSNIQFQIAGVTYGAVSSTGMAVTGDLAVSGTITSGGSSLWTQSSLTSLSQLSNASTNYITAAQAPVQSVAGRTGNIVLSYTDINGAAPIAYPLFTGQVQAPMGSVGLPGYAFAGHSDTGLYMPNGSSLAATVTGVRSMYVDGFAVSLGRGALANVPNDATAIGFGALANNSTYGFSNTAVGYLALKSNTDGDSNTAVGAGSLTTNTDGYSNAAFGTSSLSLNSTGNSNTAIGEESMRQNATGNKNAAVGFQSMVRGTTGSGNSVIGYQALSFNLTGGGNTALGYQSLLSNTAGNNTATGIYSMRASTSGIGNVANGEFALYGNTTGNYNTGVGSNSGASNNANANTSNYITLLGANSTASLGASSAAAYMTAIGAGASVSTINTVVIGRVSDKTVIGATGDSGSAALLQITGASQHVGIPTASAPVGSAGMLYYDSTLGRFQYNNGAAWKDLNAGAANPLSSITAATANNTINNAANAQAWNWQLTGNTTAYSIGETAASTGGTFTQYLMSIGTLAGSTAIPLSVSARGVEVFHVATAQIQAASGTAAVPVYSFAANPNAGMFAPAAGQIALVAGGTKGLFIDKPSNNVALGGAAQAFAVSMMGTNNIAIGDSSTLTQNSTGSYNVAIGVSSLQATVAGTNNVAVGGYSLSRNKGNYNAALGDSAGTTITNAITGSNLTFIGAGATISDTAPMAGSGSITLVGSGSSATGLVAANPSAYMSAFGSGASVSTINTVVLGRATDKTVIGATGDNGGGSRLQVTGGIQAVTGNIANTAGQYLGSNGTAALPTYSFSATPSTGVYALANGNLAGSVSGTRAILLSSGSVAIGQGALVTDATGDSTAVGYQALANNGSFGFGNTGLGYSALYANGTGYSNTATGASALYSNTSGASNTANGFNTLFSTTTGIDNSGVGESALYSNTSGNNNTATGYWSLYSNTTGSNNTANGYQALKGNVTGLNNTAMGNQALLATTGNDNTAVGKYALKGNTTGVGNVAFGTNAILTNTTGSFNTGLGYLVGSGNNAFTNSSGYITLIGANASAAPTASNANAYMTAVGAGSTVTTISTVVLGRTTDKTVIGATGDNGGGSRLQVTGGIQAVTGNIANTAGQYLGSNGTAALPTYSFLGNTNTGLYSPSSTQLAWSIGGTPEFVIDKALNNFSALGALSASTTGSDNIAIGNGYGVMLANTTGSYNLALGRSALNGNTTGGHNIGLGVSTLFANSTGSYNVAVGDGSMVYAVGNGNIAVGQETLRDNTGSNNIAMGLSTLDFNSGSFNIAAGYTAMYSSSGTQNIALGTNALYYNGSASSNIAIGAYALRNSTSGGMNVGIGDSAGNSTIARTGTNSVFLGANTTNADTTAMAGSGYLTLLGSGAQASGLAAADANAYMTALGAGSNVTTINTVVLGRTTDKTVIGATGDNGSGNSLQVTGGIQAVTGNITNTAGQFIAATGTVAAPTYSFAGNLGTGLYVPVPNEIALSVNGMRSMWLSPSTGTLALGGMALAADTGTGSTAMGYLALSNNTGAYNVATGGAALYSNTSGAENVANGTNALSYNTTGSYNAAVGNSALYSNDAGSNNVSVGYSSMLNSTSGDGNVAAGSFSLLHTTGSYNIASGYFSLSNNGSGSYNTAIGTKSGYNNSVGAATSNYITLIGAESSASPGASSSVAYMTAIGAGSSVSTINTVVLGRPSDKTVIGAAFDNLSGSALQVTGGSQVVTGNSVNTAGQFIGANGTVALPTYSFSTSPNSGLYLPDTSKIALAISGLNQLVIDNTNSNFSVLGAIKSNTTGINNVGIGAGYGVLTSNTTGYSNVSIGSDSLHNNTTGYGNVALGVSALYGNVTGTLNVAIGNGTMNFGTGSTNVSIGPDAMRNSTGSENIALGANALSNGSGDDNVALGYGAGRTNGTAFNNIAIGKNALNNVASGGYNIALGYGAGTLTSAIGGTNSVFLGSQAGPADNASMAGSGFITLLGSNATASGLGSATASAYMTAVGAGSSVTSVNTIVLGRASDSVAIGQTMAGAYQLTVNGTAGGTSAYAVSSDRRFKQHIAALAHPLDIIKQLEGVSYEFNRAAFPDRKFETGRQIGFIAQQIEGFVPEIVRTDKEGYKSVQYSQLVPLLVEGIKEQQNVLQHILKLDANTLSVNINTFQAQNVIVSNFTADTIKVAALEADTARIKKLEADSIDAKSVRSDVVKTGETSVFVSDGMFQPVFTPGDNTQYLVNAVAEDGSMAFASVAVVNGKVMVKPVNGTGLDIVTIGKQVGLVAASKKVKATWIRMS